MQGGQLNTRGADEWFGSHFTKICLGVEDEAGLLAVYQAAMDARLPTKLIQDSGTTEFGGVPTYTCLAIGPALIEEIDKVTADLSLM